MSRAQLNVDELTGMMNAQSWMTPEEALALGFADEIDSPGEFPELGPEDRIYEDVTDKVRAEQSRSYEDGISAERERFKALDELYTPSRASIINRAKYETGESAQEIALELLKAESVRPSAEVNNFKASEPQAQVIDAMAEYINRRRGN